MSSSNSKQNKKESKNVKALFSAVCLCIIALGMIVYFSTNTKPKENSVNQQTTIQQTTEVQHAVTVTEKRATTENHTTKPTTKQPTTQPTTMDKLDTNVPYKSFYQYPLTEKVAKGYSEELSYDDVMGDYRSHSAVDFVGNEDDEIVSINDGLVMNVYVDNMLGTVVEIDHGAKLVVKYCGLKSAMVKKGEYVSLGEKIGTLGTVPREQSSGAHLHLEARLNKKLVNPLDVMGKTE